MVDQIVVVACVMFLHVDGHPEGNEGYDGGAVSVGMMPLVVPGPRGPLGALNENDGEDTGAVEVIVVKLLDGTGLPLLAGLDG